MVSALPVRDSALQTPSLRHELEEVRRRRGLLALLVRRALTERYRRSLLGTGWSLLGPALEIAVLWLVFSHAFRGPVGGTPYVVYLASGVVLLNLFRQTVMSVATTLINERSVISKVYVPALLLVAAAAIAAFASFLVSLVPLVVVLLAAGVTPSPELALVVVPAAGVCALGAGIGMVLAGPSVRYQDVLEFTRIGLLIAGYLVPVIYPFSIVPDRYRPVIEANPLYHAVVVFRDVLYDGPTASLASWLVTAGAGAVVLVVGATIFSRRYRDTIAVL